MGCNKGCEVPVQFRIEICLRCIRQALLDARVRAGHRSEIGDQVLIRPPRDQTSRRLPRQLRVAFELASEAREEVGVERLVRPRLRHLQ